MFQACIWEGLKLIHRVIQELCSWKKLEDLSQGQVQAYLPYNVWVVWQLRGLLWTASMFSDWDRCAYYLKHRWVWFLLDPLTSGAADRTKVKQGCRWAHRSLGLFQVYSQDPGQWVCTWAWGCLLKMVLLSLWLHWSFTVFYLDLRAPTKALWLWMADKLLFLRVDMIGADGLLFCHLAHKSHLEIFSNLIFLA